MTKPQRWAWLISTVAATGAGLVLAFLLSIATNNPALYERHYVWLFWVNVTVAALLVLVIGIAGVRLLMRVKRGKFGSRLLLKLAAIFALVGVVPGVLIYTVSYQFVSRSIESWFDVKVETALDAGLKLGKGTLDAIVADVAVKTRLAAERLGETPGSAQSLALERVREQLSAQDIAIVGPTGQTVLSTSGSAASLMPERPALSLLRQARNQRVVSELVGLDEDPSTSGGASSARVRAIAFIPTTTFALNEEERYLLVNQLLPRTLATNALAVQAAYREYQQRALARGGLRKMYIGTLTLALVLAVFGALLLAVTLSNQLARPLLLLAEGMRQVAGGDLSAKPVFASRDELGGLTRSFADMTTQLSEARELVQRSVVQVEGARANLQTILDNLTAGVIVFDRHGNIDTVNPGATRIMRLPLSAYRGQRLADVPGLEVFAQAVGQRFELHSTSPEAGERDHWQDSFELQPAASAGRERGSERASITLLVRGASMPQGATLMVFDDITELVSAQRSEAWTEVARRLAHEIKNPLTPIQLSAERLQHKLGPKLEGADQAMLGRSVDTIVNQVQAMKALVNEFRDYARLPAAHLIPIDLNALVAEVLGLYGAAQEAGHLHADLAPALPAIVGDSTQLRQVIHNLVQNALDAVADQPDGRVRVCTEIARS
ncbi:MAG TPA: histidine kinase dimerization/phospho-acceptor domain-containing protein, partial [Burkholderiaceae bacterium]|nr:histidine kinase dimerization/phospho-acceptor domain-containing protein [Burkholderiaceae bacterium]